MTSRLTRKRAMALRRRAATGALSGAELHAMLNELEMWQFDEAPTLWLTAMLPAYFPFPFAAHHEATLDWLWSIQLGERRRPEVDVWARGGAKSTLAEAGTVMVGARGQRKYGLYICRTQDKADDHVQNCANMLESPRIAQAYPDMARRAVGMYGTSKGWRRNRLRTANGFTLDAVGLDTDTRGLKQEEQRPDWIVVDDIDDPFDSAAAVKRMIDTLTLSILPVGSADLIVWLVQNLVHNDGVFAQVIDRRAEMLGDRVVNGPIPAIAGDYRIEFTGDTRPMEEGGRPWRIVGGEPTWLGQDVAACEAKLALIGPTAWEAEAQHKPRRRIGGMYDDVLDTVVHCSRDEVPALVRVAVCVDPAVTETDGSDCHGVQCDGIGVDGVIYRLRSWEERAAPRTALVTAITWAYEEGALEVGIEMNLGADLSGRSIEESWGAVFSNALDEVLAQHPEWHDRPRVRAKKLRATASTGSKQARSSIMHADYELPGRIVHVTGYDTVLEAALERAFVVKPFDLVDAAFYSWQELRHPVAMSGTGAGAFG